MLCEFLIAFFSEIVQYGKYVYQLTFSLNLFTNKCANFDIYRILVIRNNVFILLLYSDRFSHILFMFLLGLKSIFMYNYPDKKYFLYLFVS